MEPTAAGSGITEIKAYLNGINLNKVVRIRVLIFKVIGMCFSVGAGLPLGNNLPLLLLVITLITSTMYLLYYYFISLYCGC